MTSEKKRRGERREEEEGVIWGGREGEAVTWEGGERCGNERERISKQDGQVLCTSMCPLVHFIRLWFVTHGMFPKHNAHENASVLKNMLEAPSRLEESLPLMLIIWGCGKACCCDKLTVSFAS